MSRPPNSRWWYGVAFFIGVLGLTWASYGLLHLVSEPQVGSPPTLVPSGPETGLLFLFSLITVAATILIGGLLAPLYWHCLVSDLLNRRSSVERLMRSVEVIVLRKLYKPLADAPMTAHPRIMEAVDSHFELEANTLTGVAVRSRSQVSSKSAAKHSLRRSASVMINSLKDLLVPQTGLTRQCLCTQYVFT